MADSQWPAYVGWTLTGIGWMVVSYQANRREVRKEKRSEVDACCKLAAEVLDKARAFYTKSGSDSKPSEGAEVRFAVHRLLKRMQRLQRQSPSFRLSDAGGDMLEALTGGDFESRNRPALDLDDPRIQAMEQSIHVVMDELEDGFAGEFTTFTQRAVAAWRESRKLNRLRAFGREWG